MPKLDIVPMEEAKVKTTSESASVRKRAQLLRSMSATSTSSRRDRLAGLQLVLVRLPLL